MSIGEKIRLYRKQKNMTQKELGGKIGLSDVRIRQYELGYRTPKQNIRKLIANALEIPVNNFTESAEYGNKVGFDIDDFMKELRERLEKL